MSDHFDYVPSYDSDGNLRHYATAEPEFESVGADELNTERRPEPGDVQAAIDAANTAGGGTVILRAEETYDPAATWEVKPGVTLDYNGAEVVLSSDIDVLHVHRDSMVLHPRIDVSGVAYTSSVFTFDPAFSGSYNVENPCRVLGGRTLGTHGEGTFCKLEQTNGGFISWVEINTVADGFATSFDINSAGGANGGWINSNIINGIYRDYDVGVHFRGDTDLTGNQIDAHWQPNGTPSWFWVLDNGFNNQVGGVLWDPSIYANGTIWDINAGGGGNNTMLSARDDIDVSHVDDALGNNSNRVWTLGRGRSFNHRWENVTDGTIWSFALQGGALQLSSGTAGRSWDLEESTGNFISQGGTLDMNSNPVVGVRDIPGAAAADLAAGEVATDSTNGRIVWKDAGGTAYYVAGTAL